MGEGWKDPSTPASHHQVVGQAIQDITAARLGRGFLPLGVLLVVGIAELTTRGLGHVGGIVLTLGAPLAAGAMLAYGLRSVQRAFGREDRPWMYFAQAGSVFPPTFGLYVLGWRGLRDVAAWSGLWPVVLALLFCVTGFWLLRSWMRLVEVDKLAQVMSLGVGEEEGGEPWR